MLSVHTIRAALAATLGLLASYAHAAIYTVGTGSGCTHQTIQSAILTAEQNPGADTIRVTRSQSWLQQALSINTSQHLNLVGGFATCDQSTTDNVRTTLDGAGGALEPVMRISVATGGIVKLRHLVIQGGDEDGGGYGGGIYFRGDGILELIETTVANNIAGYGGGIYAEGTGSNAELVISNDVYIQSNTARLSGGGVYNDGVEMTMNAPGSWIAFNKATGSFSAGTGQWTGGYGGGIQIVGGARASYTYIGSPGVGGAGPVYGNEARYGGGISLISNTEFTSLDLYSTSPDRQTSIRGNFAHIAGGGLFLRAEDRGGGFIIGHPVQAKLNNADLIDNGAPDGSAAFLARTSGLLAVGRAGLFINSSDAHPSALPCPQGRPCSRITDNADQNASGDPTGGAVIVADRQAGLFIEQTELSGNRGGRIIRALDDAWIEAVNTLWVDNAVSQQLIHTDDDVDLLLENTTIAGNAIGAPHILNTDGRTRLQRSVLWQPGKTVVTHSGDPLFAQNIVANERQSLDGGNSPYVLAADPRFVDPANADYRLRAASPAVDFASTGGGPDVTGHIRGVDLPIKANRMGSGDLGAYERQALLPLIHNGDFDNTATGRLNMWTEVTPGASSWTGDQNASGAGGSGSIAVSQSNLPAPRLTARSQCIHLPGPGRYLLNGWGRSGGQIATRDSAILRWELRHNGTEACNAGPPSASGDHLLAVSASWVRPASPAVIDLSDANWTNTSSLTIQLVVVDNGITFPSTATGWFDGITLDVESLDLIFADGFDNN